MKKTNLYPKYKFVLLTLFLGSLTSVASAARDAKSICGAEDEREPSNVAPIARLVQAPGNFGCTGTLVSPNCMISAGHCGSFFRFAEFNVPHSTASGAPTASADEDRYPVEQVIARANSGDGNDWAVMRLGPNSITGELPGNRQGFVEVSFDPPQENALLRITGYGKDRRHPTRTATQQTATGLLSAVRQNSATISYAVDTEPGNSGASIIDESTGKVIGVHTTGYCGSSGGGNVGTAIAYRAEFRKAIEDCMGMSILQR